MIFHGFVLTATRTPVIFWRLTFPSALLNRIPQMNRKPGWIFALLPRFDKTAERRGRHPARAPA